MTPDWQSGLESILGSRVGFDEPMSRHTTWKVGGPAEAFCRVWSEDELVGVLELLSRSGTPWRVIGRGSNLLVSDDGVEGAILVLEGELSEIELGQNGEIRAGGGASLTLLLRLAAEHDLSGLEFATGIPGSVGGAVFTNAGARGWEFKDVVTKVRMMGPTGGVHVLDREMLNFTYRRLRLGGPKIIVSAIVKLRPGSREDIEAEMKRHLAHRQKTQPLNRPSAGSVFLNPPGDYAGRMIDTRGLRGSTEGGVRVSNTHANFIVNLGGGTAADIVKLIGRVVAKVKDEYGVTLTPEVHLVGRGFEGGWDALL